MFTCIQRNSLVVVAYCKYHWLARHMHPHALNFGYDMDSCSRYLLEMVACCMHRNTRKQAKKSGKKSSHQRNGSSSNGYADAAPMDM